MADYAEVVKMLGDNLASFLELTKKWLLDWKVDLKSLLNFFHQMKKTDLIGLLNGTHIVVVDKKPEHPKMKLEVRGIEIPELTEEFDLKEFFIENKKVKYYLGDSFKRYVLNPVEKVSSLSAMSFDKHNFIETIYDKEIMEHFHISLSNGLMTQKEILRTIAYLTSKQPNGEEGILKTNGDSILIGYIFCGNDVVRAVGVYWNSSRSKWDCNCHVIDYWYHGNDMLSRN